MIMVNIDLYPAQARGFLLAQDAAAELLKKGEIKAFSASYTHDSGRMIHVESDQGWNPDPLFQEFDGERPFAPTSN